MIKAALTGTIDDGDGDGDSGGSCVGGDGGVMVWLGIKNGDGGNIFFF